jgi:hypothetical protein
MRKLLFVGTTGLVLAFGAAGANAQSIRDRPESSPRALQSSDVGSLLRPAVGSFLTEGRSAYVGAGNFGAPNAANGSIKNAAPISQEFDTPQAR